MPDTTRDLAKMKIVELENLELVQYHPLPEGAGKPTEVHILSKVKGSDIHMTMRLKSRRILDEIVAALIEHGDAVWPK